jgi:hypothetical protein
MSVEWEGQAVEHTRKISAMWKLCEFVNMPPGQEEKRTIFLFQARNSHYFSDKIASHAWRFLCWILTRENMAFLLIFSLLSLFDTIEKFAKYLWVIFNELIDEFRNHWLHKDSFEFQL